MGAHSWPDPSKVATHLSLVARTPGKRLGGDRRKVMIPATIVCPDGITHACVIRDMSTTGAKLSVSRRHRLPQGFSLAIPGRDLVYSVQCAWQRSDFAGVTLALPRLDVETG